MAGLSQHPDGSLTGEDESSDTSPESAAVARGAARTAATSAGRSGAVATRGAIAGRLPQTAAAKASKTLSRAPKLSSMPRPSPPKVMPRGTPRHLPRGSAPRPTSLPKMKAPRPSSSSVRVPRARVPKSTSSAAPKLSSRIPKARTNTIARATDRASMGFDALSAGLEQNEHTNDTSRKDVQSKSNAQWMKSITRGVQQIASFGRVFVTNTILGMAVFATYEGIIDHVAAAPTNQETSNLGNYENTEDDSISNDNMLSDSSPSDDVDDDDCANSAIDDNQENHMHIDAMDRATLPQHFLAGAAGGAAHAVLSLALEVKVNASLASSISSMKHPNHTSFTNLLQQTKSMQVLQLPSMMYSASSISHHALAHSVLFGSYQLTKRALLQYVPSFDSTNNASISGISNYNIHIASIAIAGGIAGQMQHVTSHFTEQWLGLEEGEMKQSSSAFLRRMKFATWPTIRSTLLAFPPSAIGFVAFEYGKLMISSDDVDGG